MTQFIINGFEVTIFEGYDGDQVYIVKDEVKVYSARTTKGKAYQRAFDIIAKQ